MNNPGEKPGKRTGVSTLPWKEEFNGDNSYNLHRPIHSHLEGGTRVREDGIGHYIHLLPHFHRYYYY